MSKKSKSRIDHSIKIFLKILDSEKNNGENSSFLSGLLIVCYFCQTFSYIFKFQWEFENEKMTLLAKFLFYSNFSNLMIIFESLNMTLVVYIIAVGFSFYFYVYPLIFGIFKLKIQKNSVSNYIFNILNKFYAFNFKIFFWILFLPNLEIMINPLTCDISGSYLSCDDSFRGAFLIISVIICILNIFLGFSYIFFYQNCEFLELDNIKTTKNASTIAVYLMRASMPILFPFIAEKYQSVYYIFISLIVFLCFIDYFENWPIRSPFLNKIYIMSIISLFTLILIIILCNFSMILIPESVFVIFFLLGILAIKFGLSIYRMKYYNMVTSEFSNFRGVVFACEEIILCFRNHKTSTKDYYFLLGLLKSHAKNCNEKNCKLKSKHMKIFENMTYEEQETRINMFITQKLKENIIEEKKNNNIKNTELTLLKYISFLANSRINYSQAYYEIQKSLSLFPSQSYITSILVNILIKKIHFKIRKIENERKLTEQKYGDDKSLDTTEFFLINKHKNKLEKHTKKLLTSKLTFWERYKDGHSSYEGIIADIYNLVKQVFSFRKKIDYSISETSKDNIVNLKFESLFYCVILNNLHLANKVEDEIENIKKRYIKIRKDSLSPLSFIEENLITCEASFLDYKGIILEKSKNEKLADFFGYNRQEIKLIKSISQFMPEIIGKNHGNFFQWSLRKSYKEQANNKRQIISFAINKKHFVFPIKIYLGYSLHYENDFVMHSAIMKINMNDANCLLFDKNGLIIAPTEDFFQIFYSYDSKIKLEDLTNVNIYTLIPKLKEILTTNKCFDLQENTILKNLNGAIIFPSNLIDIIEILKFKKEEIQKHEKNQSSYINSTRSIKSQTIKSPNSNSFQSKNTLNSKALSTKLKNFFIKYNKSFENGSLNDKRDCLEKLLDDENDLYNEKIFTQLSDSKKQNKRNMNFDLNIKAYRYGKTSEEILIVCWLKINVIGSIEEQILFENQESVVNVSFSQKSIVLPPNNEIKFDKEFQRTDYLNLSPISKNQNENESSRKSVTIRDEFKEKDKKEIKFFSMKVENTIIDSKEKNNQEFQAPNVEFSHSLLEINSKNRHSNSSSKSREREKSRLENLRGNTTDKGNMLANLDNNSMKTSSISSLKKSYSIFNTIKLIQGKLPRSIFLIVISLIFQIILIFSYCIIIFFFATDYINNSYNPLQNISIDQCRTNIGIDLAGLILNEYEYVVDNYSTFTDFQKTELPKILNISYNNAKTIFYTDRNIEYSFSFGNYLQNLYTSYVDYREPSITQKILLSDMTDIFLQNLNTVTKIPINECSNDILKNIFINFPYYASTTKKLRDQIQNEFVGSIDITSNNVLLVMVLMMTILTLIKLLEYFIFSIYYLRITKLVNIFLRVSIKEALNEISINKDIKQILENQTVSYLHIYFPDKILNKKEIQLDDAELQNLSTKKKKSSKGKYSKNQKRRKNISLFNLRNLSKTKVYVFIIFTFVIGIGYFFSNYYFWTISADNVSNLLKINTMFSNLYIYSTTALNYQSFLFREKIKIDPEFSSNPDYYQNHENRLAYFSSSFIDRLDKLNEFTRELPQYSIAAKAFINDPLFDNLILGDSCLTLKAFQIINEQQQMIFCQEVYNGAFQKGIISLLDEFENNLTTIEFTTILNSNDTVGLANEKIQMIEFLKGESHANFIIGDYYLSELLYIYYNYLRNYYSSVLGKQVLNLQTFVWITCIFFSFLIIIIASLTWRYLKNVYTYLTLSMGLLPYEKIANEDQTIFLIKQYWKEHD